MTVMPDHPVVFFDGACPFCNRWAWRLRALDSRSCLRFAAIQGKTAQRLLSENLRPAGRPATMVLWLPPAGEGEPEVLVRSRAALRAFVVTGSWASLPARLLQLFPTSWGDAVYGVIERRRTRGTECPLPTQADLAVLLP